MNCLPFFRLSKNPWRYRSYFVKGVFPNNLIRKE